MGKCVLKKTIWSRSHSWWLPKVVFTLTWGTGTSDWKAIIKGSQDPLLKFGNWLDCPTALGNVLCLLLFKRITSEIAKWKRHTGQGRGRVVHPFQPLSTCTTSQHLQVFTNPEALGILLFRGTCGGLLKRHDWINHCSFMTNWICSLCPLPRG